MLTIRHAENNKKDIETINRLAWIAFPHTYRQMLTREQIVYMMYMMYSSRNLEKQMSSGHHYHIFYSDGEPCAYTSVEEQGNGLFHLQKIYILPDFQGRGFGRIMFKHALDFAKSLSRGGKCTIELNVNRDNKAVHFYEHMGMRKIFTGDFDIGCGYLMTDYIMAIDL